MVLGRLWNRPQAHAACVRLQTGGTDAIAAEDVLQARLAKKLGLKSKRAHLGGDDGLDDLVAGLDSSGPSDDEDDDPAEPAVRCVSSAVYSPAACFHCAPISKSASLDQ